MSAPTQGINQEDMICRMCQHRGSDVQFKGCGCTLHARCVPLSLIIGEGNPMDPVQEGIPPPVQCNSLACPVCQNGVVSGMYLFPLSLSILDRAVEIRKRVARAAAQASNAATASTTNANGKRQRELDNDFHEVQAESSYLLLSHTRASLTSTMSMETDLHRTGRWTSDEIAYVDFLLNTFDRGLLALPHGIKLNEFLGEVLLCKSSRLTKKMKNARLSTRSYTLRPPMPNSERLDAVVMSSLQEKFLQSLSNESTQLELLFNLTKMWRTHFSNLCLQVGYSFLDAADWVNSLEAMEHRASEAEEMIRKARRRRMGLALRTDARSSPGVFFANRPMQTGEDDSTAVIPNLAKSFSVAPEPPINKAIFDNETNSVSNDDEDEENDADFIAQMLELSAQPGPDGQRNRLLSMDLEPGALDDMFINNEEEEEAVANVFEQGPFLQELITFLEKNHLPFMHVDVWVPSFLSEAKEESQEASEGKGGEQLRLFHAGYATRNDVNPMVAAQFNEFGEYSKKFSFAPGVGLPGRVYESGKPDWNTRVDQAETKFFERAGGAKVYGVKTVFGVPLTSSIGKLVVAMYSMADIQRNESVIEKCVEAFSNYAPEPKWRLIVEMGKKDRSASVNTIATESIPANDRDIDFSTCFDGDDFATMPSTQNPSIAPIASESRTVSSAGFASDGAEEEQRIATLLGEYMPLSNVMSSSAGEPTVSATGSPDFLNEFMQLRLLLLRPRSRRSTTDNELIDILRKSFLGYSHGNRRSGSELATLLVNDWRFLRASSAPSQGIPRSREQPAPSPKPSFSSSQSNAHQCHVMDAPKYNTYSASGAPTKRPSSLGFNQQLVSQSLEKLQPRRTADGSSAAVQTTQRRISLPNEVPDSPVSNQTKINLVKP